MRLWQSPYNPEHPDFEQEAVKFDFYAVLIIEECSDGRCCCGRKYYDYSNATMVFLKPGEVFRISEAGVLPTSEYCATRLELSVSNFNDLLKFETGKTLDEYFQMKRLEAAKKMLLKAENTPTIVTRQLGYPNVQYFSLRFKKIMGIAPNEYRYLNN